MKIDLSDLGVNMYPSSQLWAINEAALKEFLSLASLDFSFEALDRARAHFSGVQVSVVRGVATIPIKGVLEKNPSVMGFVSGSTPTTLIRRSVDAAVRDKSVKSILLSVDSPGGEVDGLTALEDILSRAAGTKPMTAQVDGQAASAALWAASQADQIFAERGSLVGSIGVVANILDFSEAFEKDGVKVHQVSTGAFKGAGAKGTPFTEGQKAEVQRLADSFNDNFKGAVARGRGMSLAAVEEVADGRLFTAQESEANGLINGIQPFNVTMGKMIEAAEGLSAKGRLARVRGIVHS